MNVNYKLIFILVLYFIKYNYELHAPPIKGLSKSS